MLTIQLLGDLEVRQDGALVPLPPSRKTRVLLGYLAATGRSQRRERLCELLWEVPDDPRGGLRWSLSKLRGLLDRDGAAVINADRQAVALELAADQVDLTLIRAALRDGIDSASTDTLAAVAGRFRGPFLAGLEVGQSPELQSWIAGVREECRSLHAEVLAALDDRYAGTPEKALPHVRDLVQLDPTLESSWRRLIERLVGLGRRQEAEAQYAAAVKALAEVGGTTHVLDRAMQGLGEGRPAAAPIETPEIRQEIRFCRADGGARIAYAVAGSGPPLIKTANWMNHLEYDWETPIWDHFLHGLASRRTLVRYDALGIVLSYWDVD